MSQTTGAKMSESCSDIDSPLLRWSEFNRLRNEIEETNVKLLQTENRMEKMLEVVEKSSETLDMLRQSYLQEYSLWWPDIQNQLRGITDGITKINAIMRDRQNQPPVDVHLVIPSSDRSLWWAIAVMLLYLLLVAVTYLLVNEPLFEGPVFLRNQPQ